MFFCSVRRDSSTVGVGLDAMPYVVVACLGIVRLLGSVVRGSFDIAWPAPVSCRHRMVAAAYRLVVA